MFDRRHNARVAQILKEDHLIERTPEEIDEARKVVFRTIKNKMVGRGYEWVGELTDEQLLAAMVELDVFGDKK